MKTDGCIPPDARPSAARVFLPSVFRSLRLGGDALEVREVFVAFGAPRNESCRVHSDVGWREMPTKENAKKCGYNNYF